MIKKNADGQYTVSYSCRHPISRMPVCLRRKTNDKRQFITSMAEAQRIYNQLVIEVNQKLHESVYPTWRNLLQKFYETSLKRGLMPKTVENYKLALNAHTVQAWGHRRIDSINTDEIRALVLDKLSHRSENQKKNVLKFIRAAFNYGVEIGAIERNPTPLMKFRIGDKIRGVLTEPQVELLLNRAKEFDCEWYEIWAAACYTGMRNGELYALTWDKVNLDNRTILVNTSWNNVDGFKSTKSGDDRMVEIAPPLVTILKELKLQNFDSAFVFPRIDKWTKGEQARELRLFLMGLGLPRIRFHDLRATWATIMLSKGVEPVRVMIVGGWKDLKTLMIYLRKSGVETRGVTDGLNLHNPSRDAAKVFQFGSRSNP